MKIGSSLLAPPEGMTGADIQGLAADLAAFSGEVTVVTSGAVASGRRIARITGDGLASRQALSATGQIALMARWQEALAAEGLTAAQILLTADVLEDRTRYLNARAAFRALHAAGIVPLVNENDAVATQELRAGDNDRLAAQTAGLLDADTLVLLSDVDGLYDRPPGEPGARHRPALSRRELAGLDLGGMESRSGVGTGGMASKLRAAALASSWGVGVIIASGMPARPLRALLSGEAKATVIEAAAAPMPARRRWLSGRSVAAARVFIDAGAAQALAAGNSLLAVGVKGSEGRFEAGDLLAVEAEGETIGYGLAACSDAALSAGKARLVLHRDDLVLEAR